METMERAGRLVRKMKVSPGITDPETRAQMAWPVAAGKYTAAKTRPTSLVRGNITLPAGLFSIGGVSHHGGQAGGTNPMRDIPRFVEMMEKGQFNTKALATRTVPLDQMMGAYEEVLYRTTVTAIMTV